MHEFLQAHSPRSDMSASSDDGMSTVTLEQTEMLTIATQISAGKQRDGVLYVNNRFYMRNIRELF